MSFKRCQGLKAWAVHLSPIFLLSVPPPLLGGMLGLLITEVVSYFPWKKQLYKRPNTQAVL